jgi:hypothetical protein
MKGKRSFRDKFGNLWTWIHGEPNYCLELVREWLDNFLSTGEHLLPAWRPQGTVQMQFVAKVKLYKRHMDREKEMERRARLLLLLCIRQVPSSTLHFEIDYLK